MREHSIIFEDKEGNRFPLEHIQFGDTTYKFYRDAMNVILKEI